MYLVFSLSSQCYVSISNMVLLNLASAKIGHDIGCLVKLDKMEYFLLC